MPAHRGPVRTLILAAVASLLASQAPAQTLLWSAHYNGGPGGRLGTGRPFQVDGSGAVTLSGTAETGFLLVRFTPEGALDRASMQAPVELFNGVSVTIDALGRAIWAGGPSPLIGPGILAQHTFESGWELLSSGYLSSGVLVEDAGGGDVFLVVNNQRLVAFYGVKKFRPGSSDPDWSAVLGAPYVSQEIAAATAVPADGVAVWDGYSVSRVSGLGDVSWQASSVPFVKAKPALLTVGALGRLHASGTTASGDFGTVALDAAGAELWRRTFDGPGHGNDTPTGIATDVGGSLYVTGSSVNATGNSDYVTVKYDGAGNLLWARTYDGGGDDAPAGVAVDGAGNAWVTGASANDVLTLKYDASGTEVFRHQFVSPGATVAGVAVDGWGNATVAFDAAGDIFALRYGEAPTTKGPLAFRTVEHCRAFDSRDAAIGGPNPLAGPSDHVIALAGVCDIPSSAQAVSLNVTAIDASSPGSLALFPAGQTASSTSAINYAAGQARANNATVGLGTNAGLGLRVGQGGGSVHVLIDVVGYWQ